MLDRIDWDPLEETLGRKTKAQQTTICKYIHDWQNFGQQKKMIDVSSRKLKCPFGCESIEIQHHYLYCKEPAAVGKRQQYLQKLYLQLEAAKKDPFILLTFTTHISDHLEFSQPNPPRNYTPHPMPPIYFDPQYIKNIYQMQSSVKKL